MRVTRGESKSKHNLSHVVLNSDSSIMGTQAPFSLESTDMLRFTLVDMITNAGYVLSEANPKCFQRRMVAACNEPENKG
jgi:hypothetical protein